jgi:glycosyltransferase involved in cell wall biosynthesis
VPQIGLQALACGTAVTGSDCGGIPEIIREGETGRLFPIGDAAALARRIVETLDQQDDTNRMRSAGRTMVVQDYSSEVMLDKLEAIYRRYLPL